MMFLQAGGANAFMQFAPILMILIVFYFFMIRPQMKRQKEQQSFADSLEKGREVVTSAGIIGKIRSIDGQVVSLEISNNTFIRVTKNSISKEMTEAFTAKS